jgi:hypothetical protein
MGTWLASIQPSDNDCCVYGMCKVCAQCASRLLVVGYQSHTSLLLTCKRTQSIGLRIVTFKRTLPSLVIVNKCTTLSILMHWHVWI